MTTYIRLNEDGKRPTFINPKQISYIIDKGHRSCELVMSAGGDMNTGLPGAIRVGCSAEVFIETFLGDWVNG